MSENWNEILQNEPVDLSPRPGFEAELRVGLTDEWNGRPIATPTTTPKALRHRPGIWLAAAACVVALVAGAAAVLITDDDGGGTVRTDDHTVPTFAPDTDDEPTPAPTTLAPPVTTAPSMVVPPTSAPSTTTPEVFLESLAPPLDMPMPGETQQTIIGDITWTFVEGDSSTLPSRVDAKIDDVFYHLEGDGGTWRSSDGLEWEFTEVLQPGIREVYELDGEWWANVWNGDSPILTRWDGQSFVPVDLPRPEAARLDGLESTTFVAFSGEPILLGDDILVPMQTRLEVPWDDVLPEDFDVAWDRDTESIHVFPWGPNGPDFDSADAWRMSVELSDSDPERLEFRNTETDELVIAIGVAPGVDPKAMVKHLVDGGRGAAYQHTDLLIGGGDGFELISTPWSPGAHVGFAELNGDVLAMVNRIRFADEDDSQSKDPDRYWGLVGLVGHEVVPELWTTSDGRTWERLELPEPSRPFLLGGTIEGDGSSVHVTSSSTEPDGPGVNSASTQKWETWFTDDGRTWQPLRDLAEYAGFTQVHDIGWTRGVDGTIQVSPDGLEWQELPFNPGSGFAVLGRTIFVDTPPGDGDRRSLWVGTLAEN